MYLQKQFELASQTSSPGSNLFRDIVNDYKYEIKRNTNKIYYKKDIVSGIKLIITIVGIAKIGLAIGGAVIAAIGSILSFVGNNPQAAARCAAILAKNSGEFEELFKSAGKTINSSYHSLSGTKKKQVRTVVILLVAKQGISWDDLH